MNNALELLEQKEWEGMNFVEKEYYNSLEILNMATEAVTAIEERLYELEVAGEATLEEQLETRLELLSAMKQQKEASKKAESWKLIVNKRIV